MKTRFNPYLLLVSIALVTGANAATIVWVGDTDNVFDNPLNWPSDTLPSLSTDTWQINGVGSVNTNATLSVGSPLSFTAATAKIAFGASSGSMSLSGSDITLFQGTGDGILSSTSGTTTINNSLVLGDGSVGVNSISNSNVTGGLLKVTGNITGGTGAVTPGLVTLSFGSTDNQDGNYEVTGNITKGATATAMTVTMRGDGTATLSGTNSFNTLGWGGTAGTVGTVRINGGMSDVGTVAGSGLFTQTLRVSGGILNVVTARNIRSSLLIDGGTMNISGDRLSFNAGGQTFTMSRGSLNVNGTGSGTFGARLGGDSGPALAGYAFVGVQSGGDFTVKGNGAQDTTFQLGSNTGSIVTSYTLSGGTLDVLGNNSTNGWVTLGADGAGTSTTTLTVSGTGKLISRSNPALTSGGINGRTAAAAQVLDLAGGTLFAGRIDGANLRGTALGTNGTLVNNGTKIAPGDVGSSGTTKVVNTTGMTLASGSLAIDIGGTTPSTALQDASSSGKHDQLNITGGNLILGGTLNVSLIDGFVPSVSDTFTILTNPAVSGTFTNVSGGKVSLAGGATFDLTNTGTAVTLSNYQAPSGNDYASWISNFSVDGQTGANDDFDNDNLDNVVENVLGSNPSVSNTGLTQISATGSSVKFQHDQSNTIASDVTKSYQWSTDLVDWKASGQANTGGIVATISPVTIIDVAGPGNDMVEVTVTATGAPAKIFARLVATKAP